MALVTSKEMFAKAYDGGYAIGAFNVNNMEIVQGITEACQEEHAPVILQVSKGARAYANHTYLVKLVEAAVECCPDIPIVLHLNLDGLHKALHVIDAILQFVLGQIRPWSAEFIIVKILQLRMLNAHLPRKFVE